MNPIAVFQYETQKPMRSILQRREFHKLLKEAYMALADDLDEKGEPEHVRTAMKTPWPGHPQTQP